jgi:mannan endo-1,4-beta-mannosidase
MKQKLLKRKNFALLLIFIAFMFRGLCADVKPVTPNASPEAVALLNLFYSVSGKYIFTGQHNYPNIKDRNTFFAADYIGKTPVVFSTDMGFAKDGDTDSYLARIDIVKEAIRQHKAGSIITLCWHAVPPTADEPVTFRPLPGANPDMLASVQGQLTDQQFQDLLTPGTNLYNHWCSQVDSIARYLKMLQEAHIPVLWRPYHEMNGSWFWWGGRQGTYSTLALYKQLYDRLVNLHKLNNLVWVWSVDRPNNEKMQFKDYYPGSKYLDILALDVYGNDFKQDYYDKLLALSEGKPMVLGEVGNPPAPEIIDNQPMWGYYVVWAGMVRNISKKQYAELSENKRVLYKEDINFPETMALFRKACKLEPLDISAAKHAGFSGNWIINEDKSEMGSGGPAMLPYKISVSLEKNEIEIVKTFIQEFIDNRTDTLRLSPDGKELVTEFRNSPMRTTAVWSARGGDSLKITSKVIFTRGGNTTEMVTKENWYLSEGLKTLTIQQNSSSSRGERKVKMVFDKKDKY